MLMVINKDYFKKMIISFFMISKIAKIFSSILKDTKNNKQNKLERREK
jgi:hypothetical protein